MSRSAKISIYLFITLAAALVGTNWTAASGVLSPGSTFNRDNLPAPDPGWQAEFYDNANHAGMPIMTRYEAQEALTLEHNWLLESPADGVPADGFSSRWTRTFDADTAATATVTLSGDDEIRVFVDGVLQLQTNAPWEQTFGTFRLTAGRHELVVEHREFDVNAAAFFSMTIEADAAQSADNGWHAQFFANPDHEGEPVFERFEAAEEGTLAFRHDWFEESPGGGVPSDQFSSRWTRNIFVPENANTWISLYGDDELRVLIDGVEQLKTQWPSVQIDTYIPISQGLHEIVVEHRELVASATVRFDMRLIFDVPPAAPTPTPVMTSTPMPSGTPMPEGAAPTPVPAQPASAAEPIWQAEYFDNTAHEGVPVLRRSERAKANWIIHTWGEGSPGNGVPVDYFSSRWTRVVEIRPNTTLHVTLYADDNLRLLIDGVERLRTTNPWALEKASYAMSPGSHTLVVEHVEEELNAIAHFEMRLEEAGNAQPTLPEELPDDGWLVSYFDNNNLEGTPLLTGFERSLSFQHDWQYDSPNPAIPNDNFSVSWARTIEMTIDATVDLTALADDSMRVYVDGIEQLRTEKPWQQKGIQIPMDRGRHSLVVEFRELQHNASAHFSMTINNPPTYPAITPTPEE